MKKNIQYDQSFIDLLMERSEYELWFLEEAYRIAGKSLFPNCPDQLVYSLSENEPKMTIYGTLNAIIGDWRAGFLSVGSPLIFVTTFKLLDMFLDLVLEKNGHTQSFRFKQKIKDLKKGVVFPDFIESRPFLKERIVGLYETLEPFRGTIIHDKQFSTSDGNLKVSSTKRNEIGPEFTIERGQLRDLTVFVISIIRCIKNDKEIHPYQEKLFLWTLENLQKIHGKPLLGQIQPTYLTVRKFIIDSEIVKVNLDDIRHDIEKLCVNQDVVFDLRIVICVSKTKELFAYLIPAKEIECEDGCMVRTKKQLELYTVKVPEDIKTEKIFSELNDGKE